MLVRSSLLGSSAQGGVAAQNMATLPPIPQRQYKPIVLNLREQSEFAGGMAQNSRKSLSIIAVG